MPNDWFAVQRAISLLRHRRRIAFRRPLDVVLSYRTSHKQRPLTNILKRQPKVLPNDPQTGCRQATKENDRKNDGCVSLYRNIADQF